MPRSPNALACLREPCARARKRSTAGCPGRLPRDPWMSSSSKVFVAVSQRSVLTVAPAPRPTVDAAFRAAEGTRADRMVARIDSPRRRARSATPSVPAWDAGSSTASRMPSTVGAAAVGPLILSSSRQLARRWRAQVDSNEHLECTVVSAVGRRRHGFLSKLVAAGSPRQFRFRTPQILQAN
jgi:hypothetical protein